MKRLLLTFTLLVSLIALPTAAISIFRSVPVVIDSVRPLQWVEVAETGESTLSTHCTASYINETYGYWLTAAHCVRTQVPFFIAGHPAVVVAVMIEADLAILQTELAPLKALKLAKNTPDWTHEVRMGGYPYGIGPLFTKGMIANPRLVMVDYRNTETPYMIFQMEGCPGNSGSPVVNSKNSVVSVLQIGFDRGCAGLMGGAPFDVLVNKVGAFFGARAD